MIYLIHGKDQALVRAAVRAQLAAGRRKHPGLIVFRFSADDYSPARLEEALVARNLLTEKFVVVLDGLWASAGSLLIKYLPALAASPNLYLFAEAGLDRAAVRQIIAAGAAVRVKEIKVSQAAKKGAGPKGFNPFTLTDALGARDRRRAWVLFQTALVRGLAPEEIFWPLVWKVKSLLLVQTAGDPSVLDWKPFALAQARRHSRNFKLAELKQLSSRLVALWHDHRRGRGDFALGLERWLLEF